MDGNERASATRRAVLAALGSATAGCTGLVNRSATETEQTTPVDVPERTGTTRRATAPDDGTVVVNHVNEVADGNGEAFARALHEAGGLSSDVSVVVEPPNFETVPRWTTLVQRLDAGESVPDLLAVDYRHLPHFVADGLLRGLSSVAPRAGSRARDRFLDQALVAASLGSDRLYGLPLQVQVPTLCYRRDLVEAAGYSPGTDGWAQTPRSWVEWSNVVADAQDAGEVRYGLTTQWDRYTGTACCTFHELLTTWGGAYFGGRESLFGPIGQRSVTVEDPSVVQSLRMMRRLVHGESVGLPAYAGDIVPAAVLDWTEESSRKPFADGRAVANRNWPYAVRRAGRPDALGRDLGVAPLPYARTPDETATAGTGGSVASLGCQLVAVNSNTERPEAVRAVLEAMTEPAFLQRYGNLVRDLPPETALWDDGAGGLPDRYLETFRVAAERALPHPVTRVWQDEASAIAARANAAVAREQGSEQAMAELADTLAAIEAEV